MIRGTLIWDHIGEFRVLANLDVPFHRVGLDTLDEIFEIVCGDGTTVSLVIAANTFHTTATESPKRSQSTLTSTWRTWYGAICGGS